MTQFSKYWPIAALREGLASRGRRLVEQRYDWTSIASGVASAFRSLLSPPVRDTAPGGPGKRPDPTGTAGDRRGRLFRREMSSPPRAKPQVASMEQAHSLRATREQLARQSVHDPDFQAFARYPFFRRHARVVMDVGANRGQSIASFLATLPDVEIHTFEANPAFHGVLEAVAANCAGRIHVYPFGLGKEDASVDLYLPKTGELAFPEEASTRRDYFELPWVKQKFEDRGGLSLDVIVVDVKRGDGCALRPDIVKIDVEGAEADVLAGLQDTIAASRPVLLVENADWHTVTAFLSHRGYQPYRFIEADDGTLVPFFGETTNTFYIHQSRAAEVLAQ